jgi:hypothetical protein
MPIYMSQGRYSREAIKGMLASPEDRTEAVSKLIQGAGSPKSIWADVTFPPVARPLAS